MKLAYNQAPEFLYFYLDRYFDFSGTQALKVKAELQKLQAWHRRAQLPAYIETLQKLQPRMPDDISAAQACDIYEDLRTKLLVVAAQAAPPAAEVAQTFGEDQFVQMQKKFAKDNEKFRDEYIDAAPSKVRRKRLKDAIGRAEKLYGNLEERQVEMLEQIIDRSTFNANAVYAERVRRQQEILGQLRTVSAETGDSRPARAKVEPVIQRLIAHAFDSPDASYRGYFNTLKQEGCKGFADLHRVTTSRQRATAVEALRTYEQDFRSLAALPSG